jgi:hypothetical protein
MDKIDFVFAMPCRFGQEIVPPLLEEQSAENLDQSDEYREDGGRPVIDCRETSNPDKTRRQEGNLPSGTWADERTPDQPGRAPLLEFP